MDYRRCSERRKRLLQFLASYFAAGALATGTPQTADDDDDAALIEAQVIPILRGRRDQ